MQYGQLFLQDKAAWESLPLDTRLRTLGFTSSYSGDDGLKWTTPDSFSILQSTLLNDNNDSGAYDKFLATAAAYNPRTFVNKFGVLPLDSADYNGNLVYTDQAISPQGKGDLLSFLRVLGNGSGGKIVSDPILGRVYVPDSPATFDPYRDFSAPGGNFINRWLDSGGLVKALAGGIVTLGLSGIATVGTAAADTGTAIADLSGSTAVNADSWVSNALADGNLPAAPGSGLRLVTTDAGSLFSNVKNASSVASAGSNVLKLINPSTGLTRTVDATAAIPPGWVPASPTFTTTGVNPVDLSPQFTNATGQAPATPQNIAPIDATTLSPIVVIALLAAGAFLLYGAH